VRLLGGLLGPDVEREAVDAHDASALTLGQRAGIHVVRGPRGAAQLGKAELRGTAWTAHNVDARPLVKGQRGRVVRVDGLTLDIRAE